MMCTCEMFEGKHDYNDDICLDEGSDETALIAGWRK